MSKHNNNNNNEKKIVETTAAPINDNNEVNLDDLLDQFDEEPVNTEANTEETNVNETQEESNMNGQNNTQVQNTQAQETSKKEKVISVFKGVAKYGTIVLAAGTAGWFGHKYLAKDASDEPTAEQAFL